MQFYQLDFTCVECWFGCGKKLSFIQQKCRVTVVEINVSVAGYDFSSLLLLQSQWPR